jgi:hypothetical protein
MAREGAEMLYQFSQPHTVDASAYTTTFVPDQVTPYEQGTGLPHKQVTGLT